MDNVIIAVWASVTTTVITQYIVRKNFSDSVKDTYRKKYFDRRFECYLKFWSLLRPLSRHYDDKTIIKYQNTSFLLNVPMTNRFIDSINDFFFSELGIFLSRDIRRELFTLRDLLVKHLAKVEQDTKLIKLTHEESKEIKRYRSKLINLVRGDVGIFNVKFDPHKFQIDNSK